MDIRIIDALKSANLITTVVVNENDYNSVDDLIAKGIITIPGAKSLADKIIASLNITEDGDTLIVEDVVNPTPAIEETSTEEAIEETPVSEPVIDETIVTEPVIDETSTEEAAVVEEVVETTETPIEETVTEVKKTRKTTKK